MIWGILKKKLAGGGILLFALFFIYTKAVACDFSGMTCEPPDAKSCQPNEIIVQWSGKNCSNLHYQCSSQTKCVTGNYTQYSNKFDSGGDTSEVAFGACTCNEYCLKPPANPKYYDTPEIDERHLVASGEIADAKIDLPVLLTWESRLSDTSPAITVQEVSLNDGSYQTSTLENLNSNRNLDAYMKDIRQKGFTWDAYNKRLPQITQTVEQYGPSPQSYLVEFLNDPANPSLNFNDNERAKLKKTDSDIINDGKIVNAPQPGKGMEIFQKLVTKEEFNSTTDGKPCFLNSASTIKWRVRLCCDKAGLACMPSSTWWQFNTSGAPEPIGITDKTHPVPQADPDWNGPKALGQDDSGQRVDFCSAALKWCAAKIEPSKMPLNLGVDQALAYQMMVSYDEGVTLDSLASDAKSGDWWDLIQKAASYLNIPGLGSGTVSQCHYLLVKEPTPGAPKVCTAEVIKPHTTLQKMPVTEFSNATDPNFNRGFFTKNLQYDWSLRRCFDNTNAGDETCQQNIVDNTPLKDQHYGQTWSFKTVDDAALPAPLLATPPDDPKANDRNAAIPVGIPPTIAWKPQCGANSFEYELDEGNQQLVKEETIASQVTFVNNPPAPGATLQNENVRAPIKLDTVYRWKAQACWPSVAVSGDNSKLCDDKSWTDWFSFRTTGRPPQNLKATGNGTADIPTTFTWDQVPGAKSYVLDLSPSQGAPVTKLVAINDPGAPETIQIAYPDLKPKLIYNWKVKTCADAAGTANLCGAWSTSYSFGTSTLPAPAGYSSPRYLASLDSYPAHLSWNSVNGAAAYRVTMSYINEDANSRCPKSGQLFDEVTLTNSYDPPGLPLACLGSYTWGVVSCFSAACDKNETGASTTWEFFIVNRGEKNSGFMVCGLRDDNPKTPWDERDDCQFGDLFKILEKLIDFALFKLAFWLLPILAAITGGLFYTQAGGQDVINNVKTMWKYIGIGYALLFFAWLLTTWTLQAFGYHGLWWKIL